MFKQKLYELKVWKKKPVLIFSIILVLMIFFLMVKMVQPCREYRYEGTYTFEENIATDKTVIYNGIQLKPGVYRIELEYNTDTDTVALCTAQDGTVFKGGLLTNGEHMYSGLNETGYEMWLYEGTDSLQIVVSYGGSGSLTTGALTIIETNQLWTMLLTIVLFMGMLVYSALIFYYYDKSYSVASEKKHAFFCVMAIGFIASIPYLCGFNFTGADLTYHFMRIEGVKDGLLSGQFPVRLEPRWVYDHGYANAIFYCNTFLYLPALLRMLGFTISASYNAYGIALSIGTAWIAYYCFSRIFGKRNIGIICSALYTLSIIRTSRLVITTAVGEGSALTFIPLVIYGLYRVFTEDPKEKKYKTAWIPIMIGYAGLIQTHVLTCEITAIVTIIICLIHIRKILCWNTFLELAKGALSAVLVSFWYLVPFLDYYITQDVHIRHVSARTIQDRGLYFAQLAYHFWTTGSNTPNGMSGMQYSHPLGVGLVLIVVLGIFLVLWFAGAFRKLKDRCVPFVKVTAVTGILLLFMSLNIFPWDRIQSSNSAVAALVSSLQFPYRFLGWGTVCLVLVFGFCLWYFENHNIRFYWVMVAVAVIGVTTSDMHLLDYVNSHQGYFELYNEESMGFGYVSGAEYLIEGTDIQKLTFADAVAGDGVAISYFEPGPLEAKLECSNATDTGSYVDVPLLLYKGYRAEHVESGQEMELCAGENNVVRVLIPANFAGSVEIYFESPIYWRISEIITAGFLILLAVMYWRTRRRKNA